MSDPACVFGQSEGVEAAPGVPAWVDAYWPVEMPQWALEAHLRRATTLKKGDRELLTEICLDAMKPLGFACRRQTSYAKRLECTERTVRNRTEKLVEADYIHQFDRQGTHATYVNWEALGLAAEAKQSQAHTCAFFRSERWSHEEEKGAPGANTPRAGGRVRQGSDEPGDLGGAERSVQAPVAGRAGCVGGDGQASGRTGRSFRSLLLERSSNSQQQSARARVEPAAAPSSASAPEAPPAAPSTPLSRPELAPLAKVREEVGALAELVPQPPEAVPVLGRLCAAVLKRWGVGALRDVDGVLASWEARQHPEAARAAIARIAEDDPREISNPGGRFRSYLRLAIEGKLRAPPSQPGRHDIMGPLADAYNDAITGLSKHEPAAISQLQHEVGQAIGKATKAMRDVDKPPLLAALDAPGAVLKLAPKIHAPRTPRALPAPVEVEGFDEAAAGMLLRLRAELDDEKVREERERAKRAAYWGKP